MELTRKQVIEILEKADSTVYKEPKTKTAYALEYAISSLKTDEAYQIMYEGGDIFTKDDMVAVLEDLKAEIDIMSDSVVEGTTVTITSWRGMQKRICKLVQSKIDKLKENTDGNDY